MSQKFEIGDEVYFVKTSLSEVEVRGCAFHIHGTLISLINGHGIVLAKDGYGYTVPYSCLLTEEEAKDSKRAIVASCIENYTK